MASLPLSHVSFDERPLELTTADFVRLSRTLAGRGPDTFEALARELQALSGADCVVIGQIHRQPALSARSLVWVDGEKSLPPTVWELAGTPCEQVFSDDACVFPSGVRRRFPDDRLLVELGIEAYFGVPLLATDGTAIGLMLVMHRRPLEFTPTIVAVTQLVASRAAVEVQGLIAQQNRTRTEDQLDLALNAAGMGAWHWDVVTGELRWDVGFCDVLGFPRDVTSASLPAFLMMLPRRARAQLTEVLGRGASAPEDDHAFEVTMDVADRGARTLRSMGRLFRDADGEPHRVAGVIWDVTQERESRERLERSERRYRGYFELELVGLAQLTPQGVWTDVNEELCRMLGRTRAQLLGRPVDELVDEPELRRLNLHLTRAAEEGRAGISDELHLRRADGSILVASTSLRVQRDARGRPEHYVALVVDTTERRRLESQLIQSQKLEAVGRLAGGVAHDFNNVLAVVLSSATLLQGKVPPSSQQLELVTAILDSAERGSRLTKQLLAFSRPQPVPLTIIDATRVLRRSVAMLRRLVGDTKTLEVSLDGACPVRIEEAQFEQVIMNLVVNARDATSPGGHIGVALDAVSLSEGDARDVPEGRYVRLRVTDDGHGMDSVALARLFEPFFTTKPAGQGTGLGLATCHGVVKQAGGAIEVASHPGEGTTFTVLLPEEEAPGPVRRSGRRNRAPVSVLLVEYERAIVNAMTRMLSTAGHRVLSAADATQALKLLETESVDVVVSDVRMPGMDGLELGRELARLHPDVGVVLTSGQGRPDELPASHFLQKPYSLSQLLEAVDASLASRRQPAE